ncbi:MAG: hypothetical protein MRY74_11340 [Neomegalonema sp.]|nr:hypothetical protein [Neomegalonema sp.]
MRSLSEFLDENGKLPAAEERLRQMAPLGEVAAVGHGALPEEGAEKANNTIRAAFLRYLALGGCADCRPHEKGVRLKGAVILGALDLEGCRLERPLSLADCWFKERIILRDAETRTLSFDGCRLNSDNREKIALAGQRLRVRGALQFRNLCEARGQVALERAIIDGDLICNGARFIAPGDMALRLTGAEVRGGLFFRLGPGVDIQDYKMFEGSLVLTDATAKTLIDDERCWPDKGRLILDGFAYQRISWASPTDFRARRRWLKLQIPAHLRENFRPHPWERLERTLREQGSPLEARRIGVERERQARRAGKIAWYLAPLHRLYGAAVGYGYFTSRALLWSLLVVVLGAFVFEAAWRDGAMAPAHEVVLDDPEWRACAPKRHAAACWIAQDPGRDYEPFQALVYSFDLFLPVLSLEMEPAWTPSASRGSDHWGMRLGALAWGYRLVHEALGYLLSAFAIAGAARLVRENER